MSGMTGIRVHESVLHTPPSVILPAPPPPPTPMGLIAATGRLPVLVAKGMKEAGHPVHAVALAGQHDEELREYCDSLRPVAALNIGSWIRKLRRRGITHAVMVGRLDKAALLHSWINAIRNVPDMLTISIYIKLRKDKRSHLVLASISEILADRGILLIDSTAHISDQLATEGVMTKATPTGAQRADIEFGWRLLREMLRLDIGQAIAVHKQDVVSVEAVEGTDRMISRTSELCRAKGWTLMKAARAGHDRRADVPTVGPTTIQKIHDAGGRCVALAAGDVIIVDKDETIALANKLGVSLVGIPRGADGL